MQALRLAARLLTSPWRCLESWLLSPADPRAYACLRIGYATSALFVLVDLWPARRELFSNVGILGGSPDVPVWPPVNLLAWLESETQVTAFMAVSAAALVCLALGILQRPSAIVAYLWATSYTTAVPEASSGYDMLLRVVAFVMVISPTVSTWTWGPSALTARGAEQRPVPAYALRLVQWQLALVYLNTAWMKSDDRAWRDGDFAAYFLMSVFARSPSGALAHGSVLSAILTWGTLIIEFSLPALLWTPRWRWWGIALGAALHVGIGVTSQIALFSFTMLALYTAFLQSEDFEKLERVGSRVLAATRRTRTELPSTEGEGRP